MASEVMTIDLDAQRRGDTATVKVDVHVEKWAFRVNGVSDPTCLYVAIAFDRPTTHPGRGTGPTPAHAVAASLRDLADVIEKSRPEDIDTGVNEAIDGIPF